MPRCWVVRLTRHLGAAFLLLALATSLVSGRTLPLAVSAQEGQSDLEAMPEEATPESAPAGADDMPGAPPFRPPALPTVPPLPTAPLSGSFEAPPPPMGPPLSAADVAALVAPSVVQVYTRDWAGSGVKVAGGILTNVSIVQNNRTAQVVLPDGRLIVGTVILVDPIADLALLSADDGLAPLEIEDSSNQRQGDTVLAFGYPRPLLIGGQATLTGGIISALRKDPDGVVYVQTDAALNPGNAGGALVNMQGKLIGLPILKARFSEGLGFAIAGETIRAFLGGALLPTPVPLPTGTPRPTATPRPTSTPRSTSTPLPPRPTLAPLAPPTSNPSFSTVIRAVSPEPPYCALRNSEDTSERLIVLTGDSLPQTTERGRNGLQFRHNLTGDLSLIFDAEVNFSVPGRVSVDLGRIRGILWRDRRVSVSVRLFDNRFAPDYRPISDFSPPFFIADDQATCG